MIVLLFVIPILVILTSEKFNFVKKVGTVTLCYGLGFIFALLPVNYNKDLIQTVASVVIALAIPLILFGFDLKSVRKLAGKTVLSFALLIITVIAVSISAAALGQHFNMENTAALAGAATGLYVGGTPNMFAIGKALIGDINTINMINISDTLFGGLFFFAIISFLKNIYKKLPDKTEEYAEETEKSSDKINYLKLGGVVLLAAACLGTGAGLEILINGNMDGSLYILVTVSVLGIVFSLFKGVREVNGTYDLGQYLILVFSLGLSMSIDFSKLVSGILPVLVFFSCIQIVAMIVHLVLCRIFKIDGGTALITYVAGIYGPPFISLTANSYNDKNLIVPGFICGTLGLVIGNLLGLFTFKLALIII